MTAWSPRGWCGETNRGGDSSFDGENRNLSSCHVFLSHETSTRSEIFTPGDTFGGKTPYGCNHRNGCRCRMNVNGNWHHRGSWYQKAHKCQLCPSQLLNGNAMKAHNVCTTTKAFTTT